MRRRLPPKVTLATMNELFDFGEAYVEVPSVDSVLDLINELHGAGVAASIHAPKELSVRVVREGLGLSQAAFAIRFGLEEATVKNWEQKKSRLNTTAKTLIWTIHHCPQAVIAALDMSRPKTKEIPVPAVPAVLPARRAVERN